MVKENKAINIMLNHKSIRKYTDQKPSDEMIEKIVRAGQQAPFASQLYSVLLSRKDKIPFGAPLLFTICVDFYKMKRIMEKRNWKVESNDLSILLMGIQDASLMSENMVIAGESLGLGSCYLGAAPYHADKIIEEYNLPDKVFTLVQLVMGYPAEDKPPRPRYPMDFVLFEDEYPELDDGKISRAMEVMDEGYLAQDYYKELNGKIPVKDDNREDKYTYEDYSWTEHISRKWGQRHPDIDGILEQLRKSGFEIE